MQLSSFNGPCVPELREFEQMAGRNPAAERAQLRKALSDGGPGWARLMRKMLFAKAPPTEA